MAPIVEQRSLGMTASWGAFFGGGDWRGARAEDAPADSNDSDDDSADASETPTRVYVLAACAAVASGNVGFDLGINADASPFLQRDLQLSREQLGLSLGLEQAAAILGTLCASAVSDKFGRRKAFVAAPLCCIVGRLWLVAASSYRSLLVGRVLVGIAIGYNLTIAPVYITEMAPARLRGTLGAWPEIVNCVGMLLAFIIGSELSALPDSMAWRFMSATGCVLPLVMLLLVAFVMLESPRWLVQQRRFDEAGAVLCQLHPQGEDIDGLLAEIRESIAEESSVASSVDWGAILCPAAGTGRMLLLGNLTAICQQVCAIDAITFYFAYIMRAAGAESEMNQLRSATVFGAVKLVCTFLSGPLFDNYGRRPIMMISLTGIAAMFAALAWNFAHSKSQDVTICVLAGYVGFYSMGIGPGSWLIPSELFSNTVRAKAMSLASLLNRLTAALVTSTFLSIPTFVGWSGTFALLAGVAFVYVFFVLFFLPETKGRTLESIAADFHQADEDGDLSRHLNSSRVRPAPTEVAPI